MYMKHSRLYLLNLVTSSEYVMTHVRSDIEESTMAEATEVALCFDDTISRKPQEQNHMASSTTDQTFRRNMCGTVSHCSINAAAVKG